MPYRFLPPRIGFDSFTIRASRSASYFRNIATSYSNSLILALSSPSFVSDV